jgi:plastocyanin
LISKIRRTGLGLAALFSLTFSLAPSPALAQTQPAVTISDFQFGPANLSVPVGTKVTWTNNGPSTHTATDNGVFDSGPLPKGQSFSFTFASAGAFNYICTIHPFMRGVINVTAAASAAPVSAPASAAPASAAPASVAPSPPPSAVAAPAATAPRPAASPSAPARSAAAAGTTAAPAQVPSALPKAGGGAGSPAAPANWGWAALGLVALAAGGIAAGRRFRSRG